MKVRASLRPTEAPGTPYGDGSLQQWLGLLKSCPLQGVWLADGDVRAPVQLCPAPQSCPESPVSPDGAVGTGWQGKEGALRAEYLGHKGLSSFSFTIH